MIRLGLRLVSGFMTAFGLASVLVATGPVPFRAFGSERLGETQPQWTCKDTTIKCQGTLPNNECEAVYSDTCRYVEGTPNGLTCKPKLNQDNACAGYPQLFCAPREYKCQ